MYLKFKNTLIVTIVVIFTIINVNAQLGFCGGNSGDPIFTENFGTAPSSTTQHAPLPAPGTTNYTFLGNTIFGDGKYTVTNLNYQQWNWFNTDDHTPGDTNGRMLVVNASFTQGEFFRLPVTGLCENTTYEFSSWVLNLTPRNDLNNGSLPNPCNVRFEIWDSTNTTLLKSGDTGNFFGSLLGQPGEWLDYGLVFQTQPGQTSVILKMVNNGIGGYGNDLAIDDIVFKSCGDSISVSDGTNNSISLCSSQTPYATTLTATPDNTVFSTHFYQWQESTDGTVWTDIIGATNPNVSISGVTSTRYYRSKIAESATNLNNSLCNTVSDVFQIDVTQAPPIPTIACWETATLNNTTCSWDVTGSQPIMPTGLQCWETAIFNNINCVWDVSGTQPVQPTMQCWETATFNTTTCSWDVSGTQPVAPTLACYETAAFNTTTCLWDVTGNQPVPPTTQCWETTTFNTSTCVWDITGSQPAAPTLACYESSAFNTATCQWDITGTQPAIPTGLACWETATFNSTSCNWDIAGSQPIQPAIQCYESITFNTTTCQWDVTGTQAIQPNTQCWETATFNTTTCAWSVTGTQPTAPTALQCWQTTVFNNTTCAWDIIGTQPVDTLEIDLCQNQTITLQPTTNATNPTYLWSTGEITASIIVNTPGTYDVEITDNGCLVVKRTYNVTQIQAPIIEKVESDGNDIIITTSNTGDFLYSLDGNIFQPSNIFFNVKGGLYTVSVKGQNCSDAVTNQHLHFYIPKYFTPNNDGTNDTFDLSGIEYFASSEVSIFNRYGKLLKHAINTPFSWEGTFVGEMLPTDDYWYVITIDGQKFTGHFTLKR